MDYHSTQIELILKELKTARDGLSHEDAAQRLKNYGPNEIKGEKKEPLFMLFLNQFKSTIIFILVAAIIIALAVGEILEAIVIRVILLLNAILGFIQEYRSHKA